MDTRLHVVQWGTGQPRKRTTEKNWREPLKWNDDAKAKGIRYRVFCASLADVFDNEVDPQWRADLFNLIAETPRLDWLLLTKRIGNAAKMINDAMGAQSTWPHSWVKNKGVIPNMWLGATICNQEEAGRDIPKLLTVPAAKRFLSIEPLLRPIALPLRRIAEWNSLADECEQPWAKTLIDWVIVGGESGHGARPMHTDWVRSLRDQCDSAGVAFHFKQWGEWAPREPYDSERMESDELCGKWDGSMYRFGKKAAGRLLDGRTWNELPGRDYESMVA
jgi:protein gp37